MKTIGNIFIVIGVLLTLLGGSTCAMNRFDAGNASPAFYLGPPMILAGLFIKGAGGRKRSTTSRRYYIADEMSSKHAEMTMLAQSEENQSQAFEPPTAQSSTSDRGYPDSSKSDTNENAESTDNVQDDAGLAVSPENVITSAITPAPAPAPLSALGELAQVVASTAIEPRKHPSSIRLGAKKMLIGSLWFILGIVIMWCIDLHKVLPYIDQGWLGRVLVSYAVRIKCAGLLCAIVGIGTFLWGIFQVLTGVDV